MNLRSLVDQDTDRYVFEVLAPDIRRRNKTRQTEVQWTDLMSVNANSMNYHKVLM